MASNDSIWKLSKPEKHDGNVFISTKYLRVFELNDSLANKARIYVTTLSVTTDSGGAFNLYTSQDSSRAYFTMQNTLMAYPTGINDGLYCVISTYGSSGLYGQVRRRTNDEPYANKTLNILVITYH